MNKVALTVGPQYIGKSTFCKRVIEESPNIILVSRDAILIELFGSVYLNSYSSGHYVALEKMWELVEAYLKEEDKTIILDCWNDADETRKIIVKKLRALGVEIVGAWYFVTPRETCLKWYMEKVLAEEPKKSPKWEKIRRESAKTRFLVYYDFFYENAKVDLSQGFDFVITINPLKAMSVGSLFQSQVLQTR